MDTLENLLHHKIINRRLTVGVIGIGYVGSALIKYASNEGFKILGFTRSEKKARYINSHTYPFEATTDVTRLGECDVICVCVPTPIHKDKTPDLQPIEESTEKVLNHLKPGQLIIVESSIAPGTTRNFIRPILEKSGFKVGRDFFLAFSPERVDPGNPQFNIKNTPKVVAGFDPTSQRLAVTFYEQFIDRVVPVSSLEVAEMTKILENTYRLVNISLVNELMKYTDSIGIDIWEVINAAGTKPFGFLPHYPGPGVGGHCIPVDPYYLLDDAHKIGINLQILKAAGMVNDEQPKKIAKKATEILKQTNGHHRGRVLLVGVAYKPDIRDTRESPALKIWKNLEQTDVDIDYHDPYVPKINGYKSKILKQSTVSKYDLIIIITNHKTIDYQKLLQIRKPILDTRHVFPISEPNVYTP